VSAPMILKTIITFRPGNRNCGISFNLLLGKEYKIEELPLGMGRTITALIYKTVTVVTVLKKATGIRQRLITNCDDIIEINNAPYI
jgi:hypothetical protein